jgi:hypothetical protein
LFFHPTVKPTIDHNYEESSTNRVIDLVMLDKVHEKNYTHDVDHLRSCRIVKQTNDLNTQKVEQLNSEVLDFVSAIRFYESTLYASLAIRLMIHFLNEKKRNKFLKTISRKLGVKVSTDAMGLAAAAADDEEMGMIIFEYECFCLYRTHISYKCLIHSVIYF